MKGYLIAGALLWAAACGKVSYDASTQAIAASRQEQNLQLLQDLLNNPKSFTVYNVPENESTTSPVGLEGRIVIETTGGSETVDVNIETISLQKLPLSSQQYKIIAAASAFFATVFSVASYYVLWRGAKTRT